MAKRSGEPSASKRWAAGGFFIVGVAFILLFVFGPDDPRGEVLKIIGAGLIAVGVYVYVGINLPALDWSGVVIRVLTALLREQDKKGEE